MCRTLGNESEGVAHELVNPGWFIQVSSRSDMRCTLIEAKNSELVFHRTLKLKISLVWHCRWCFVTSTCWGIRLPDICIYYLGADIFNYAGAAYNQFESIVVVMIIGTSAFTTTQLSHLLLMTRNLEPQ